MPRGGRLPGLTMTKLPIHLLLYLAILGLAAGGGFQFWQALQEKNHVPDPKADQAQFLKSIQRGRDSAGRTSNGPDYAAHEDFWNSFRYANFTGKEPPKPVESTDAKPAEDVKPEVPEIKLEDVFVIECMVFDGEQSKVILRYKPSANVQLPPEMLTGTGGAGTGPVADTVPARPGVRGNQGASGVPGNRAGSLPTFDNGLGAVQHLTLDDTLWKPYEHIRLVRVADDASYAVFRVEKPSVPKEEWKEEQIYPEVLELPQDVLRKLQEGGIDVSRNQQSGGADQPAAPAQPSGWVDMPETQEIGRNHYNIGSHDRDMIASDPSRVFDEDVGTATYRSRDGRVQGVRITRLAPGYDRYGVQEGEVLISLNGEPVGSKAEAYKVGKRLYQRGVRTFEAVFLRNGQSITRTYVAPDQ